MKKFLLLFLLALIMQNLKAGVWLVDNNVIQPGVLNNIPAAIDSALIGDTIMVKASTTDYGVININKPLALIGEGYNGASQTTLLRANIQSSDVYISGFYMSDGVATLVLQAYNAPLGILSNFKIERCRIQNRISFVGANVGNEIQNIRFVNNILQNSIIGEMVNAPFSPLNIDTLIFENNIIDLGSFIDWGAVTGMPTVILRNNVFTRVNTFNNSTTFNTGGFGGLHDAILYNNIFIATKPEQCYGCTFYYNLTFASNGNDTLVLPANNNIYGQDPLLVNYPTGAGFDYSYDYHLGLGSPCDSTGVGGTDMGIYGGYYPFIIGAGPKVPIVDYLDLSKYAVPQGSSFFLEFNARVRK